MLNEAERSVDIIAVCQGLDEKLNFQISVPAGTGDGFRDDCFFTAAINELRKELMNRNTNGRLRILMTFGVVPETTVIGTNECSFIFGFDDKDKKYNYTVDLKIKQ